MSKKHYSPRKHILTATPQKNSFSSDQKNQNFLWIYGTHPSLSALNNPARQCLEVWVTEHTQSLLQTTTNKPPMRIVDNKILSEQFPSSTPHQGIAVKVKPLEQPDITEILEKSPLLILDQVTDPHNAGAILRSAAAFGAGAVITTKDNAPAESATLAKSASGALEIVPFIKVTNLVNTLNELKKHDYWIWGLDGNSNTLLSSQDIPKKIALVLGAEGKGLRKLTQQHCDLLVKLPMNNTIASLNVSNAAAIALYNIYQKQ